MHDAVISSYVLILELDLYKAWGFEHVFCKINYFKIYIICRLCLQDYYKSSFLIFYLLIFQSSKSFGFWLALWISKQNLIRNATQKIAFDLFFNADYLYQCMFTENSLYACLWIRSAVSTGEMLSSFCACSFNLSLFCQTVNVSYVPLL